MTAFAYSNYEKHGIARHPEDVKLFDLDRSSGSYDRLLLSDSVTNVATQNIVVDGRDLSVLTNGYLKLAGQFFIMRRAIERVAVPQIDLFLIPELLIQEVDNGEGGRIRHTYTDTLFTRRDEIEELRRAGDVNAGQTVTFFEKIYKSFDFAPRNFPVRDRRHVDVERPPEDGYFSEEARKTIEYRRLTYAKFAVSPQNKYFLRRIDETCREKQIKCRLVIEPLPASLQRLDWNNVREIAPNIELVNVNDFASFPDYAFYDGLHLKMPEWAAYYRTLLTQHDLMRFSPSTVAWDGHKTPFPNTLRDAEFVVDSGFHPTETWGAWTSGQQAELHVALSETKPATRHLTVELIAIARRGPLRVSMVINGGSECENIFTRDGDATITCEAPASADRVMRVKISTSYVTDLQDIGLNDPRTVGVGVKSVELK